MVRALFVAAVASSVSAYAEETAKELPVMTVQGDQLREMTSSFQPEVKGTTIYAAKKTTVTKLENLPEVTTNNFRQLFSQTPGLLVSEVNNESFASISYRGLGDPHESFNLQIMADGTPVTADMYGYPAAYFTPPSDYVDSVEFTRGGAALMFGPQPGGALNFVTRQPATDTELGVRTKHVVGSQNLYSTYNEMSGTKDNVSYLLAYHHREADGFRAMNSDYRIDFASAKVAWQLDEQSKLFFQQDISDTAHGEPGGLTFEVGEGLANYNEDRWQSTLKFDTLSVRRYVTTVGAEKEIGADTTLTAKAWGGYLARNSKRQALGTAVAFGGIANGETNNIVLQEFTTIGADLRARQEWSVLDIPQTTTVGMTLLAVKSPFTQSVGDAPDAEVGEVTRRINRETLAGAIFAENKMTMGDLTITPGVRLENINQSIDERLNVGATTPLRNTDAFDFVPLFGLGAGYKLSHSVEAYANASQAFKPVTFENTVPLGTGDEISEDINEGRVNNFELGVRGRPVEYFSWDSSLFSITYSNQFGRVGTVFGNTGKARYQGLDIAQEFDIFGFSDAVLGSDLQGNIGSVSIYANASLLDAEFTKGPLDGKNPQYAPDYLIRAGLIARPLERAKLSLLGTFVDDHFADDGNTAKFSVPGYQIWDLTAEIDVWKNRASIVAGVNNLFNQNYYTRVRGNGIDPGLPINFYAGVNLRF